MNLQDDEVQSVERMIQWLYSNHYDLPEGDSEEAIHNRYWVLARLNTLAEKYDIVALSSDIIAKLYDFRKSPVQTSRPPQMSIVKYVYENTTENSSFRKLMVACYIWNIDFKWYNEPDTRSVLLAVPEFATDLAIAFALKFGFLDKKDPFLRTRCKYYQDSTEQETDGD